MTDILLDEYYDLQLVNGDLVLGESTNQHQALNLLCNKGDFKEDPLQCVGAKGYLKSEDINGLLAETKKQFERDGMEVKGLTIDATGNMNINAPFKA